MCNENSLFKGKELFPTTVVVPNAKATSVLGEDCCNWGVGQEQLVAPQMSDVKLLHSIIAAVDKLQLPLHSTGYFFDGEVLMHK